MTNLRVQKLLEDYYSGDIPRQVSAIMKLENMELDDIEIKEVCATLIELLASSECDVKNLVVEALGWIGDNEIETVGPALMTMLTHPEWLVRSEAVEALSLLSYKSAKDAVHLILSKDPEWVVRASAAEALSYIADVGDPKILEALQLALEDSFKPVRTYAAFSIGVLGTPEMIPTLQNYFELEDDLDTQASILAAQYMLGDHNALFTLLKLIEEADQHLGGVILNIFADLAYRKIPKTLASDSSIICTSLARIGEEFFIERYHTEKVIAELVRLTATDTAGNSRSDISSFPGSASCARTTGT